MIRTRLDLDPDEIHVWLASPAVVTNHRAFSSCISVLSDQERAKCFQFHFERDRDLYLTAHALLRDILSRYDSLAPRAWTFECNEHGRPEITPGLSKLPLRFNLSHTRQLAACAITLHRDIGVDVEHIDKENDVAELTEMAENYFAPFEISALKAVPRSQQNERFMTYWTLKESYIKARGTGLSTQLHQFWFDIASVDDIRFMTSPLLDDESESWQFAVYRVTADHLLAVGARRDGYRTLRISVRQASPLFADDAPEMC